MDDKQAEQQASPAEEAWEEVGRQFEILGQSLAAAFRTSWDKPENRTRVHAMQGNLEKMVKEVDLAIQDAAASPQGQQARADAKKVAESVRQAGEQTIQEIRPHLLAALKQVNEELGRMVNRMEGENTTPPSEEKKP